MSMKQDALKCYDGNERERMMNVIKAIVNGRLVYMRFNPDGSGTSFYYRNPIMNRRGGQYTLEAFDEEQSKIILMGIVVERDSFNK